MTSASIIEANPQDEKRHLRAFLRDDSTRRVVDQVIADLMISQASVSRGGVVEAIHELGVSRSPRILLVDISDAELPLSAINDLSEVCEPGVTVIVIGDRNDVGLFRDLIAHGISDYLVKPITPTLLQKSLLSVIDMGAQGRQANRLGRLIVVSGTRGGVGATLVATSIAWSIAHHRRRRAALIDLDLQFGTAALALDLESSSGLREALEHSSRIDGLFVDRTMTKQSDTLYVLSSEEPLSEIMLLDHMAVDVLVKELRNKFHFVIVDMPRQITPCTQQLLQTATNFVLVSDFSLASMRDTIRYAALLPNINASCQLALCANRVGEHRQGEISRREFEEAVGRPVDVVIPFDARTVAAAMNVGQPVAAGRNSVAAKISEFAERLCGAREIKPEHGTSIWSKIRGR